MLHAFSYQSPTAPVLCTLLLEPETWRIFFKYDFVKGRSQYGVTEREWGTWHRSLWDLSGKTKTKALFQRLQGRWNRTTMAPTSSATLKLLALLRAELMREPECCWTAPNGKRVSWGQRLGLISPVFMSLCDAKNRRVVIKSQLSERLLS